MQKPLNLSYYSKTKRKKFSRKVPATIWLFYVMLIYPFCFRIQGRVHKLLADQEGIFFLFYFM